MDIKHFSYFVTVVECGCNLSAAAKKLHISQSALSKIILTFEQEESVQLFERRGGRLRRLTPVGRMFYAACRDISARHTQMLEQVRRESKKRQGTVRVGIPPLVLTLLFTKIVRQFKQQYPDIHLVIHELGAEELREKLMAQEIEFAVLLAPTGLDAPTVREFKLYTDVLDAFVSPENPLAQNQMMHWADLDRADIAIFNESFSIHRLLMERFRQQGVKPVVALTSASWDFLLEAVHGSDMITILPAPIWQYANSKKVTGIPFAEAISWDVMLAEHTGVKYTHAQKLFMQYVLHCFREP